MHVYISKFNVEFNGNICYLRKCRIISDFMRNLLMNTKAEIKNSIRAMQKEKTCINLSNRANEGDKMS